MDTRSLLDRVGGPAADRLRRMRFRGTAAYWDGRYAGGGDSGAGSYGHAARWKADIVNRWIAELGIDSVIDLGCGDGNQLGLAEYPRYLGMDVSPEAIRRCASQFSGDRTKSFLCYEPGTAVDRAGWLRADLALSMEVIFHLVEDELFEDYMSRLFDSARRYVVICSSDAAVHRDGPHERHRPFSPWVERNQPRWTLEKRVDPPGDVDLVSSLYLYRDSSPAG